MSFTATILACLIAAVASTQAQSPSAMLNGSVSDESGGVLPGTSVVIVNAAGTVVATTTTGDSGAFSISLQPGVYRLRAELAGFRPFESDPITVREADKAQLPIRLALMPYGDTVVVTGSRVPEALRTTPVAVTVVRGAELEATPAAHFGDLLRAVPGVNALELSARDIQISSRTASGRNARTTLALIDGRSVYQDYFGMVLWDLLPITFDDVKQVEVLRGPGSALWGANALTGVINIITKSPREAPGTNARFALGERDTRDLAVSHSGFEGRLAYRLSGGYYSQDRWERPATTPDGTPLPPYTSEGTDQVRADVRVDFDQSEGRRWRIDGGFADSSGLILVAVGPFEANTLRQGYGSVEYARGSAFYGMSFTAHKAFYTGLLTTAVSDIESQSVQADYRDTRTLAGRHLLVYGGSFKHSMFDLNFVPDVHDRQEFGAYLADDIFLNDRVRVSAGLRTDWFNTFGWFASPRVGVRGDVAPGHTVRATYNRAYVAPSIVESYAHFPATAPVPLPTGIFQLPVLTAGDASLAPQTIDALEVGYTGVVSPRLTLSLSAYRNKSKGLLSLLLAEIYSPQDPPAGWPLPLEVLAALSLPKTFRFGSVGELAENGFEAAADFAVAPGLTASLNYSFQPEPDLTGPRSSELAVNLPPRSRANLGLTYGRGRWLGSFLVSFTDRAFWTDVLAIPGFTDSFWMLNGTVGRSFHNGRYTWLVKGTNLANSKIQQHIFGDVIRRRVVTEIRAKF